MQTDKTESPDTEVDDIDLVHRYYANRYQATKVARPMPISDLEEEQIENDWFAMGDQESWIEARPGLPRSWESPDQR
jgi:hypothetical protein